MTRWERTGKRDLTYSRWHRNIEPMDRNSLPYIDIDAVEYCPICKQPLALLELAEDVGQEYKATTVLRKLAELSGLPAFLVFYRKDQSGRIVHFRLRQVSPIYKDWKSLTPNEYVAFLYYLRAEHVCKGGK